MIEAMNNSDYKSLVNKKFKEKAFGELKNIQMDFSKVRNIMHENLNDTMSLESGFGFNEVPPSHDRSEWARNPSQ